jgi:hypothetical protein
MPGLPAARLARICAIAAGIITGAGAGFASAQGRSPLSPGPIAVADGHVTIAGDVSASFGSSDPQFFDYTDYEHSALRMLRVNVSAALKAGEHFSILGDLQTENFDSVRPYALYARIRPWTGREVDIQVGRVPPTFGAFSRRTYVSDNPLIGYPLAYQYLTSLRADSLPATVNELLQKRGLGWLVRYSIGETALDHGVPLVSAFRWDTGVQVHFGLLPHQALSATAAVTNGTISNPRFSEDNGGKQVAGRVEWRPTAGLAIGTSMARGTFVSDRAADAAQAGLPPMTAAVSGAFTQTAWGGDAEYSRDYYLLRAEAIVSLWRVPFAAQPDLDDPLRAASISIEGRYKITPGFYAAARYDQLAFNKVTGTAVTEPWDAPLSRVEFGVGYSVQRNLLLKAAIQHNHRDGGRLGATANHVATQVVFWF